MEADQGVEAPVPPAGQPPSGPVRRGAARGPLRALGAAVVIALAVGSGYLLGARSGGEGSGTAAPAATAAAPAQAGDGEPGEAVPEAAAGPASPVGGDGSGGVTVAVAGVEVEGEVIRVRFTAFNSVAEEQVLATENAPAVLVDSQGGEYPSRAQELPIDPLSVTEMTVEFAGPLRAGVDEVELRFNPGYGGGPRPEFEVGRIPVQEGATVFSSPEPTAVALEDVVAHHPNGASVALYTLTTQGPLIEVNLLAVNGNRDQVFLARNDRPYLQEPGGRRFWAVPPENNAQLAIPGKQRLIGTLRFVGPLPPDVDEVTLHLNERGNPSSDSAVDPAFTITDIPTRERSS